MSDIYNISCRKDERDQLNIMEFIINRYRIDKRSKYERDDLILTHHAAAAVEKEAKIKGWGQ